MYGITLKHYTNYTHLNIWTSTKLFILAVYLCTLELKLKLIEHELQVQTVSFNQN